MSALRFKPSHSWKDLRRRKMQMHSRFSKIKLEEKFRQKLCKLEYRPFVFQFSPVFKVYIHIFGHIFVYVYKEREEEWIKVTWLPGASENCCIKQGADSFFSGFFCCLNFFVGDFTNCRNSKVWHWLFILFMIKSDFKSNDAAVLKQHCASFLSSFLTSFLPSFKASILPSIFPSFHPRLPSFLSLCGTSCRLYPNTDPLFRAGRALRLTTPWAFNGRRVFFPN